MQELEELKKLVFEGNYDDEAKQSVRDLEEKLQDSAVAEKMAENPAIQPYLKFLQHKLDEAERILKTKRTSPIEQEYLFAIIELTQRFAALFNGDLRKTVEKTIKHNLDVAKTQAGPF